MPRFPIIELPDSRHRVTSVSIVYSGRSGECVTTHLQNLTNHEWTSKHAKFYPKFGSIEVRKAIFESLVGKEFNIASVNVSNIRWNYTARKPFKESPISNDRESPISNGSHQDQQVVPQVPNQQVRQSPRFQQELIVIPREDAINQIDDIIEQLKDLKLQL